MGIVILVLRRSAQSSAWRGGIGVAVDRAGTAALSLGPSYWRWQIRKLCHGPFATGAILLALGKLGSGSETLEPLAVASGPALIATAHRVNLRLCRQRALREAELSV